MAKGDLVVSVDPREPSGSGMLNEYLYQNKNFGDRVPENHARVLRGEGVTQKAHANATSEKYNEKCKEKEKARHKKDEQAVRRLEQEMNAMTEAEFLQKARLDQQGIPSLSCLPLQLNANCTQSSTTASELTFRLAPIGPAIEQSLTPASSFHERENNVAMPTLSVAWSRRQ